VKSDLAYGFF